EVAVALNVQELVRGQVGRAKHDEPGLVLGGDRGHRERALRILRIRLGLPAFERRAIGLAPALRARLRERLDAAAGGGRPGAPERARQGEERYHAPEVARDRMRVV